MSDQPIGPRTRAVRAGIESDTQYGAVMPPIHLSAHFSFDGYGNKRTYDYTRSGNPTRDILADTLSDLEGGAGGVVTSTGMSAVALVLEQVPVGGHVVAAHDCYGGTWRLLNAWHQKGRFRVSFTDLTDPAARARALAEPVDLVWIETPSNPLLRITDVATLTREAHTAGAISAVDNTFLTPLLQRPLALGADLVVHSTSKYLNGHSDVVGGAVVAADPERHAELVWWANCLGVTGSPFDSFLTARGLRTLGPRMKAHQENAVAVVDLLTHHPAVTAVHWPGLPSHPGHELAATQQNGFGAMISFEVAGGEPAVRALLNGLRLFSLAESLGGVESLIAHPASMTHAAMAPEARRSAGIGDTLLRLSVGIEDPADLCADLAAGLDRAADVLDREPAVL